MCEIQLLISKNANGMTATELKTLSIMSNNGAIAGNQDATGVFNSEVMYKDAGVVALADYYEALRNKSYLVVHNRYTTSATAKKNKNNHPFELGRWRMAHNGVITNDDKLRQNNKKIKKKSGCDSFSFLYLFNKRFNERANITDLDKRVVKALKKTIDGIEGWFSIVLIDKKTDTIYYFRCSRADFYAGYKGKQLRMCSTNNDTLVDMVSFGDIDKIEEVPAKTIFKVDLDKKNFVKLDTFDYTDTSYFDQYKKYDDEWGEQLNKTQAEITNEDRIQYFESVCVRELGYVPPYTFNQERGTFSISKLYCKQIEYWFELFNETEDYMEFEVFDEDIVPYDYSIKEQDLVEESDYEKDYEEMR